MSTIPVSQARARLPELLKRVESGDEVTLTRHGREVAVMLRPDLVRVRRNSDAISSAEQLSERLAQARRQPLSDRGFTADQAEERVAEIRAGRSARR